MKSILDSDFSLLFPVETALRALSAQALQIGGRASMKHPAEHYFWTNKKLYDLAIENYMFPIIFEKTVNVGDKGGSQYRQARTRYIIAQNNIHQFAIEYARVLHDLKKHNVSFVVMKALPYLVPSKNFFHKEVNDLDILVPVPDFYKAARALRNLQYTRLDHREGKVLNDRSASEQFYAPRQEEFFYKHPFAVEVHTSVVQTEGFANRLFDSESSRTLTADLYNFKLKKFFCGTEVFVFEKTYLIISLIIHAFYNHNFQSVMLFYEVGMLIQQKNGFVDWSYCSRYFKKLGNRTYYYWFLCFFDWLFPSCLPARVHFSLMSYQKSWNFLQRILFFAMKYFLFYPKTHTYSDRFNKISWLIMDRQVISMLRRRLYGN